MEALARPTPRFPTLQVALLAATVLTTLMFGTSLSPQAEQPLSAPAALVEGLRFSAALIGILLVHEMGHFVTARRHGVDVTWPYFIPVPFGVGTLGAVIRLRSPIPTRRAALDIGASGPLAGFVVAIPILLWGLAHSEVRAAAELGAAAPFAPSPLAMAWRLLQGEPALPAGSALLVFGDSLVLRGAQRLVLGDLPPGSEVLIHPVGLAAWVGLLVTTLNLIPIGQLDGGHVAYALLGGRRARQIGRAASWALLAAGIALTWTWLVWWALTRWLIGFRHPPPLVEEPRVGLGRTLVALASLAVLIGTFVPVPVSLLADPGDVRSRHEADARRRVFRDEAFDPAERRDEDLRHFGAAQVAGGQDERSHLGRHERVQFQRVPADRVVLRENDPAAPSDLREPLDVRGVVGEEVTMEADFGSGTRERIPDET